MYDNVFSIMHKKAFKSTLSNRNVFELSFKDRTFTIVVDNFLSKYEDKDGNGFTITESPLIKSFDITDLRYLSVDYNKHDNILQVKQHTISGRPIYYYVNSEGDFFCSTHIKLLKQAGVILEENIDVLPEYFVYRLVRAPHTIYKNISSIPIGNTIRVRIDEGVIDSIASKDLFSASELSYRDVPNEDVIVKSISAILSNRSNRVRSLGNASGMLLSGGLDSSVLYKIFNRSMWHH